MKTLKLLMALFAIALFVSSCSKSAAGPAGPTGPTGAAGSAGATGPSGVANISTTVFTVPTSQWKIYAVNIDTIWLQVPALTDSINDGVIISVARTSGVYAGQFDGLPMNNFLASNDELDYSYGLRRIFVAYGYSSAPSQTLKIKVIVIPPGIMKRHPGVNWKNSTEVMALPDMQQALNQ